MKLVLPASNNNGEGGKPVIVNFTVQVDEGRTSGLSGATFGIIISGIIYPATVDYLSTPNAIADTSVMVFTVNYENGDHGRCQIYLQHGQW